MVLELLESELSVLALIDNPNVVKMLSYLESTLSFYIVLEFCNCIVFPLTPLEGDFDGLWENNGCQFPEDDALSYLKQMLNGMKALHACNVIHRDLKMPNILVHNDVLKIGDLGFAKQLSTKEEQVTESMGTLGHMAPEVIEFKPYGLQADMFSLGTIYYQMLFGTLPFTNQDYADFLQDVKKSTALLPHSI